MVTSRSASGVSSSLQCDSPLVDMANIITAGMTRPISTASCSGPDGRRGACPVASCTASAHSSTSRGSNRQGSMRHTCRHSTLTPLAAAARGGGLAGVGERLPQRLGLERPLVEGDLAHARHRGHDRRLHRHGADRADHPGLGRRVAPGDLAAGQGGFGGGEEGVAAHRNRRRAGVRGLSDEPQDVALHAVGADDRAGGSAHRLEHRALLDVQLEVGARAALVERPARLGHAVDVHAVLGQRVGQPHALAIDQVADAVGHEAAAGARRPQQAAREARALLVGEVDDGQRHRRGRCRRSGAAPRRRPARPAGRRASRRWAPSRGGRR